MMRKNGLKEEGSKQQNDLLTTANNIDFNAIEHGEQNDDGETLRYKPFPRVDSYENSPITVDDKIPTLNEHGNAITGRRSGTTTSNASSPIFPDSGFIGESSNDSLACEQFQSTKCPTCQGKGKLTQSQADSMVALIPAGDKRLKPRRTKLYLGLTAVVSFIVIFLVTFFLLPRSVSLTIKQVDSIHIYMPFVGDKGTPFIVIDVTYAIKNENFFAASINSISFDITWNKYLINTTVLSGEEDYNVDGRTTKNHTVRAVQYFNGETKRKVKGVCSTGWVFKLMELFASTATVSYVSRTEQISNSAFYYVKCHNNTKLGSIDGL